MWSTIKDNKGNTYHGYVLSKEGTYFVFAFRVACKNYVWECNEDYWTLI